MDRESCVNEASVDRLSDLPRDVLCHILFSFLNTRELTRASSLSKTFMSLCHSSPILDLDYYSMPKPMLADQFLEYVDRVIRRRRNHKLEAAAPAIQKFRLCLKAGSDKRIDEAISFAINNGVKELVLEIYGGYTLPDNVGFGKSITSLTLSGLQLDNKLNELLLGCPLLENLELDCPGFEDLKILSNTIKSVNLKAPEDLKSVEIESPALQFLNIDGSCPHHWDTFWLSNCNSLKELKLWDAPITENFIEKILPNLLLLEKLELCRNKCHDKFKKIKVSNRNLKSISLMWMGLDDIEVGVRDLESFTYIGLSCASYWDLICNIDISHCKHLKELRLQGGGIPENFLQEQVSKLPELDSLDLDYCSFLDEVEISHETLKHIEIRNSRDILDTEVNIRTPQLVSFNYSGSVIPFASFHYNPTLSATLRLLNRTTDTLFFEKWCEMIRSMSKCKVLTFDCQPKHLIFPDELRKTMEAPLIDLKHMRVHSTTSTELIDSLLWLSPHLETLDFMEYSFLSQAKVYLSIKFEHAQINKRDDTLCTSDKPAQCYTFRTVEMKMFRNFKDKDNLLKYFQEKAKSLRLIDLK